MTRETLDSKRHIQCNAVPMQYMVHGQIRFER